MSKIPPRVKSAIVREHTRAILNCLYQSSGGLTVSDIATKLAIDLNNPVDAIFPDERTPEERADEQQKDAKALYSPVINRLNILLEEKWLTRKSKDRSHTFQLTKSCREICEESGLVTPKGSEEESLKTPAKKIDVFQTQIGAMVRYANKHPEHAWAIEETLANALEQVHEAPSSGIVRLLNWYASDQQRAI
jgi:hypothetical protein